MYINRLNSLLVYFFKHDTEIWNKNYNYLKDYSIFIHKVEYRSYPSSIISISIKQTHLKMFDLPDHST